MSTSDTPRTDAVHGALVKRSEQPNWVVGAAYVEMTDFARQLERELAAATARVARLEEALRNSAKAIEFAEYLAKDAEQLQKAADSLMEHFVEGDEPTQAERENYSEHYRGVRGSIYEFRKRAARAVLGETGGE